MYPKSLCAIVGAILVAFNSGAITGHQARLVRADLVLRLNSILVHYGDQRVAGEGAVLEGEPLEVDLGVSNDVVGPTAVVERDWLKHVTISVRPGGRFVQGAVSPSTVRCTPLVAATRQHRVTLADDLITLGIGGYQFISCRLSLSDLRLTYGRHTVIAAWSDSADLDRWPTRRPEARRAILEFEFREIATEADRIDLLTHLAWRAYDDGNLSGALEFAEGALALESMSSTALVIRGQVHAALGLCGAARTDLELAAAVIENGTDIRNKRNSRVSLEARAAAAERWRHESRRLPCR